MDNKIFNVNGRTKEQLNLALQLLLFNEYNESRKVTGYYFLKNKGLVLTWMVKDGYKAIPFTNRMGKQQEISGNELTDLLWDWLNTEEAKSVEHNNEWDINLDHDGSNEIGWRLYVEEWGSIKDTEHTIDCYAIAALKPTYLWYGK